MNMTVNRLKHQLMVLALLLLTSLAFSQTGILVTYYNGSEQGYSIATSGKIYFDNGNLLIAVNETATPTTIPVSIIRKITFSSVTLPLHLLDFTALNEKSEVTLSWKTENEINTSHFIIERSSNGVTYDSVGKVLSTNATSVSNYNFADLSPKTGSSFYRLKQVDADGKFVYSKILSVNRTASGTILLLPNPATNYFIINSTTASQLNVKIYATTGQLVISGNYKSGEQIVIDKLKAGMYVAIINDQPFKLIKQ